MSKWWIPLLLVMGWMLGLTQSFIIYERADITRIDKMRNAHGRELVHHFLWCERCHNLEGIRNNGK